MPLKGELVTLREERAEDVPFFTALRNDLDTQAWSQTLPPDYTHEMYLQRHTSREFAYRRYDGRFAIEWTESGELIGLISYTNLESRWSAEIGIMIGKSAWGTGAAYDAQEVLLRFMFEELGLRVIRLWTHSGNPHAVHLAERSGFRASLRQREAIFKAGSLLDNLSMDLLREEYYALHPDLTDNLSPLGG
jgi:ribosomal-protein-alanine N-acetyltransferase